MNDFDTESTLVLDAFREVFDEVTMPTPVEQLIAAGRTRRRRRRLARATGLAAIAGLSIAVATYAQATRAPTTARSTTSTPSVHPGAGTFIVERQPAGTVTVTWTKQGYFQDPTGLQDALRNAGFPVLIKVGEFCQGPTDDGYLDPSGQGRGVDQVMMPGGRQSNGDVVFTFVPSALPPGTELFIGYLSPSQLAVTQGRPGSVERLVPTTAPLTCSTQAPPPGPQDSRGGPAQSPPTG